MTGFENRAGNGIVAQDGARNRLARLLTLPCVAGQGGKRHRAAARALLTLLCTAVCPAWAEVGRNEAEKIAALSG